MCSPDDDVSDGRSDADLDAGVALFSQLALKEFVQLGIEDTICGDVSAIVLCAESSSSSMLDVASIPRWLCVIIACQYFTELMLGPTLRV